LSPSGTTATGEARQLLPAKVGDYDQLDIAAEVNEMWPQERKMDSAVSERHSSEPNSSSTPKADSEILP
jgi:hypothetical protein